MSENKENRLLSDENDFFSSISEGNEFERMRKSAYDQWKIFPVPSSRDEYWKYTRVAPFLKKTYSHVTEENAFDRTFLRDIDAYNLVFIDGIFSVEESDILESDRYIVSSLKWAKDHKADLIERLMSADRESDYFSLLAEAFHQDGPFIYLDRNAVLEKPVHISYVNTQNDRLINIRGFIHLEEGSQAKVIETWDDDKAVKNLNNARLDYSISKSAHLEVSKIQAIGAENSLISQDFVQQEGQSVFTANTISMQGEMIRNNFNGQLNGEFAECNLNGLYMAKGKEHIDNHTCINHAVPNCNSNELYKGILNEKAKGVFNGKVIVSRDAQKTNAFQYNGNILLTDDCQVYSKPELEIYADDVKCSHGSTTGQLDSEALFYLKSRGISEDNARNLLLQAFAREVLDSLTNEQIRQRVDKYIEERYRSDA